VLPSRTSLLASFDPAVTPHRRAGLLAGLQPGAPSQAGGRTVCACFAVGLKTLQEAIRERRLEDVEAIGASLKAGTNCGSCIPELRQILRDSQALVMG
jgi:assimilatory nitrate reductase catalytic subunit